MSPGAKMKESICIQVSYYKELMKSLLKTQIELMESYIVWTPLYPNELEARDRNNHMWDLWGQKQELGCQKQELGWPRLHYIEKIVDFIKNDHSNCTLHQSQPKISIYKLDALYLEQQII